MNWYQADVESVFKELNSSEKGLSDSDVAAALQKHGPNSLVAQKKKNPLAIFLGQFKDFMILILIIAAIVSGLTGDLVDTAIIIVIVLLNATIGFVQEYNAEKTMEALRGMVSPHARVLRNGATAEIEAAALVPGDVVFLEAGQVVPADIRLFESHSLRIEEAVLTGESVPADKTPTTVEKEETSLGDHTNMAYKATKIINGKATGVVVATGMATEIGKIAGMLQDKETKTPLQRRMTDFGRKLTYAIIVICVLFFGMGLLRGEPPMQMLLIAITLAVAAIPEALPALITIALAKGAKQLAKNNVVVRRLPAVETLGSVTYICSDKTGTITRNEMKVTETSNLRAPEEKIGELPPLEVAMALSNDVVKNNEGKWIGDPTELALVQHITGGDDNSEIKALQKSHPRVADFPFDSDRKRMTTVHEYNGKYISFTKGALESILSVLSDNSSNTEITNEANRMAENGMRVIVFAYRIHDTKPDGQTAETIESGLTYAGLAGMIDPPREEVKPAISEANAAGITPVMITGDHLATASAIAREIGILKEGTDAIDGAGLAALSDEAFVEKVENIRVYARVNPEQKLRIVNALQQKKHYVAMTGDGANDAPSLKSADIGIAMGITGTDVSKEAAHLILLDDNFATIVKGVAEGRRIYDNIRRFIRYIMACNGAEMLIIITAPLLGMPVPLLPIHILWINLVTDGLPGLALANEKAEPDIMKRPPRPPNESVFAAGIGLHIVWMGILMASLTLGVQKYTLTYTSSHWQTIVFSVLLFAQLGHVFAIRSDSRSVYKMNFFSNPALLWAILATALLQLCIIYIPYANTLFKTQPLTLVELLLSLAAALVIVHAVELEKLIRRRKKK